MVVGDASVICKKKEWQKVDKEFESLKSQLITLTGTDPTQNVDDLKKKFEDEAEKSFLDIKKWMLVVIVVGWFDILSFQLSIF